MSDTRISKIKNFAVSFNALTGAHMGIHDPVYDISISSGCRKCNVCMYCRDKSHAFLKQCLSVDQKYLKKALETGEVTIYRCHIGMYSVIIPICENGTVLGIVDFGMIRIPADTETEADTILRSLMAAFPQDFHSSMREELQKALDDTAVMTRETMENYIQLVSYAARGLYMDRLFLEKRVSKNEELRTYLSSIDPVTIPLDRFSVEEIAKKLNISYPHLARLAKAELGMPLKQYVLIEKLNAASRQLGSRPIKEIAVSVGVDDPRYFSKLFRRHMGVSCSEYIRLHHAEEENTDVLLNKPR